MVGLSSVFIAIPLDSNLYEKGEKKNTLTASTYINASYMISNTFYFAILIILFSGFNTTFICAILGLIVVVILNINYKRKHLSKPKKYVTAQ